MAAHRPQADDAVGKNENEGPAARSVGMRSGRRLAGAMETEATMETRNPYSIDRYGEATAPRGPLARAAGLIGCLLAMAALCLGMLYLMWKASGK